MCEDVKITKTELPLLIQCDNVECNYHACTFSNSKEMCKTEKPLE